MATTPGSRIVPSPEVRHLDSLDGVRGLAIAAVMLRHVFQSNAGAHSLPARVAGRLFESGKYGVDLFFVLSGFLITGILIDTRHDPHFFRSFFGRRALRILPLYYGVLLVLLALSVPFHWRWNGMAVPLLLYIQNFWPFRLDTLAVGPGIGLYHFWSLAIEEQFYLVWPFLVYALRGRRQGVLWAALTGVVLVLLLRVLLVLKGVPYLFLHTSLATRADTLLLGGLLAVAYRSEAAWRGVQRFAPAVTCVLGLLVFGPVLVLSEDAGSFVWRLGLRYTVLALLSAALIAWSLRPRSAVRAFFEAKSLRLLGKYSYGLYVLHILVLSLVEVPLRHAFLGATGSKALSVELAGVSGIALSIMLAYASFQLYESRFLRLKSRFPYTVIEPARVPSERVQADAAGV